MAGQHPRGFRIIETDTSAQGSDSSPNRQTAKESSEILVATAEAQKRRREASGILSDSEQMLIIQAQLEKRQKREDNTASQFADKLPDSTLKILKESLDNKSIRTKSDVIRSKY